MTIRRSILGAMAFAAATILAASTAAQTLAGAALVNALRHGGYVILMRHASAPMTPPAKPAPDNPGGQRELDAHGRATATAMGQAIKRLHIPIGEVWSSPAYWAQQTVHLAGLPAPKTVLALRAPGQGMQAATADQSEWLKAKLSQPPRAHYNTLIVTHGPNIQAALGAAGSGLSDGEALVFEPQTGQPPRLVAQIKIEDWPRL